LSNAFKYTPKGGAVSVHLDFDPRYLHLAISDTGKGIDPEEVKRIFDRFYRVEGTEEKGSGIGLALTKELVDIYRGQIRVDSTQGRGTTFKVRLPYTALDLQEIGQLEIPPSTPASNLAEPPLSGADREGTVAVHPSPKDSSKPLVLVVEDHLELRDFIVGILREEYRVLEAENGSKGVKEALEHIPDVIISDVMMPGIDGFELCAELKTNLKTSHIPVILLTAKAGQENKMTGLSRGADAYLTKPFQAEELLLRVRNLHAIRQNLWKRFQSSDLVLVEGLDTRSVEDQFLQQVVGVIRENLSNESLSVEDIARAVGFSRAQLHRKLKALTNKSTNQLVVEIRLNEARHRLEQNQGSVSEIAYAVGYSNLSYFTKSFKQKFGEVPSKIGSDR
jgi:DNA-binding response OmpR family regulator